MKNQSASTRPRGRPGTQDDADRKLRIVDTAEHLFTQRGYAATSVRTIADQAGVNPALVHYYFGDKLSLLESVFQRALEPLSEALQALIARDGASPDALVDLLFRVSDEHPNLLPLLVREALLPGGAMKDAFAERFAPRLGGLFPGVFAGAQARGALSPNADPQALSLLVLSMGIFPFVAAGLARRALGLDMAADGRERLRRQIAELLESGVAA